MNDAKIMMKMANLIMNQIDSLQQDYHRQNTERLSRFCHKLERVLLDHRQYEMAIEHGWLAVAEKLRHRSSRDIGDLVYDTQTTRDHLNIEGFKKPMIGDIVRELMQIEDEYGCLHYNWKDKTLSVLTDNIVLEEIFLGSFEIRLFFNRIEQLYKDSPYHIIALDPHPAGSNEDVTHPHVSCERLCEGDGGILIRKALEQGRLADFFSIVTNILNTYNPQSPYVGLSEWDGYSCFDCGYTVNRDDSYYCQYCENDFCSECSGYCQICDCTLCLGCAYECPGCQKPVCRGCTVTCPECNEEYCIDCMNENEICSQCEQERKDDHDEQEEQTNSTAA
jgi:hypothetical protein